ncbi:MAG TPA: hypothetical protein DCQ12_07525 [Candidatus Cloacimonas sp.]|nr:hypothetical protein [Candidatus Cloacimonas sp.]
MSFKTPCRWPGKRQIAWEAAGASHKGERDKFGRPRTNQDPKRASMEATDPATGSAQGRQEASMNVD